MLSYAEVLEQMNKHAQSPLMTSGMESKAMQVIRMGEELRGEDEPSFWDDFINLLSNSAGMAELLGINQDRIVGWSSRIRENLDKYKKYKEEQPSSDEKKEMLPTGDEAPSYVPTNSDPTM